jgi:hypothetical protein
VQIAHGGHKGGAATPSQGAAQIGNGMNDLHDSMAIKILNKELAAQMNKGFQP